MTASLEEVRSPGGVDTGSDEPVEDVDLEKVDLG